MLAFLLTLVDEGQREAIERIYYKYHEDLYKLALSLLSPSPNAKDNALDAVQNVFVNLIKNYERLSFELDEKRLKAYLFTSVSNQVKNIRRNNRKYISDQIIYENIPDDNDFPNQLHVKENYESLLNIVKELDDIYSIPLELRFVQNMSVKEIAAMLGIPEKTVYTRIARGKIIILKRLEEEGFYD